jgi:hypothetical protein
MMEPNIEPPKTLQDLDTSLFDIENRVNISETKMERHDSRITSLELNQDRIFASIRTIESKIIDLSSDLQTIRREISSQSGETYRLKISIEGVCALLQNHTLQESEQYNAYMVALKNSAGVNAANTDAIERLNKNFIRVILVGTTLLVALSLFIAKFDLISKFGLA